MCMKKFDAENIFLTNLHDFYLAIFWRLHLVIDGW